MTPESQKPPIPFKQEKVPSEAWDERNVSEREALSIVAAIPNDVFSNMEYGLAEFRPGNEAAVFHNEQVLTIMKSLIGGDDEMFPPVASNQIDTEAPNSDGKESYRRLAVLIVLLHDKEKDLTQMGSERDIFHAYRSAQAATGHLERYLKDSFGENSTHTAQLGAFIGQVIELHSDIPYIQQYFEREEIIKMLEEYPEEERPRFIPELVNKKGKPIPLTNFAPPPENARYIIRLPGPDYAQNENVKKWAHVLRAADTLSNYCVDETLAGGVNDPELITDYKYAGFVKIMSLNPEGTMADKVAETMGNAQKALESGVYKHTPELEARAKKSIRNMEKLKRIFETDERFDNEWGLTYRDIVKNPDATEEEIAHAQARLAFICRNALLAMEDRYLRRNKQACQMRK